MAERHPDQTIEMDLPLEFRKLIDHALRHSVNDDAIDIALQQLFGVSPPPLDT
jgi:hypothetical protein